MLYVSNIEFCISNFQLANLELKQYFLCFRPSDFKSPWEIVQCCIEKLHIYDFLND